MAVNTTDDNVNVTDSSPLSVTDEIFSTINGLLNNATNISPGVSVNTPNVDDITSKRNAYATTDETTVGTSYFDKDTSVTFTDGITGGISTDRTIGTFESASISPVVVEVVVPILVVIIVVCVVLFCWYRRRRGGTDIIRVWHVPRTQSIPVEIQKASWYEDEQEAEDNGGFNPFLELQPNIHLSTIIGFGNGDDHFPSKVKDDVGGKASDVSCTDSNSEVTSTEITESKAIRGDVMTNVSVLRKSAESSVKFQINQSLEGDYDLAEPIGDKETASENGDTKSDNTEEPNLNISKDDGKMDAANGIDGDDEYIAMSIETKNDDTEQLQRVKLRNKEENSGQVYANVEIREVQSMTNVPLSNDTSGLRLPKRGASESKMHTSRPPIALPRVSKKRSRDIYDPVPEIPNRIPEGNTSMSTKHSKHVQNGEQNTNDERITDAYDPVEIVNGVTNEYSDTENNVEDDIYDYPRNNSQVVYEDEEEGGDIYKVPPSEHT